jgi:uncharacterized protein
MSDMLGSFVWYDLQSTDIPGAISFYNDIIGWKTKQLEGEGSHDYTMWLNRDAGLGGIVSLPEKMREAGAPPQWMAYVATNNIDESVAKVKELGGTIYVPPKEIPNVGKFSVFADPQGAMLALLSPMDDAPGSESTGKKGCTSAKSFGQGPPETKRRFLPKAA